MSDQTQTVRVKEKKSGRVRVIDLVTFNDAEHEVFTQEVEPAAKKGKAAAKQKFELSVTPEGKFVVVDAEGKAQGEEAFEKKEDAEALLAILSA